MFQLPASPSPLPQMRRPKTVHDLMEPLLGHLDVDKELLEVLGREFAVIAPHERDALFPCEMAIADLVRRIRCRTTDAEFDESKVVVEAVYAIVEAGIL